MAAKTDIISRMEANQARFGRLQLEDRNQKDSVGEVLDSLKGKDADAMRDILTRMSKREEQGDRKPSYWDRVMSDPNRRDRYDDALLEAHMEAQRQNEGEDE